MNNNDVDLISMNDIFVLRPNGKIAHLEYEDYTQSQFVIESLNRHSYKQRYFTDKNGRFPANLVGPAVTKVIDWNLSTQATVIPSPKTGYFIDLRRINLNRSDVSIPQDAQENTDAATFSIRKDKTVTLPQGSLKRIPESRLYQLAQPIEEDNLYIAYYKHPDRLRKTQGSYQYRISYIPSSVLDLYEFSPQVKSEYSKEDIIQTTSHLEQMYGQTNAQSGALNPDDMPTTDAGSGVACYIANLRTFQAGK